MWITYSPTKCPKFYIYTMHYRRHKISQTNQCTLFTLNCSEKCSYMFQTSTIYDILRPVSTRTDSEHTRCSMYKLTCSMCKRTYGGQTGRSLRQRYLEHIGCIGNSEPQSTYAIQILNRHKYGDINSMSLIRYVKKGSLMNTFEQFHIQLYALNNKLVNEQYPGEYKPLFQLLTNFLLRHNHVT
jgi:hypothetical protein